MNLMGVNKGEEMGKKHEMQIENKNDLSLSKRMAMHRFCNERHAVNTLTKEELLSWTHKICISHIEQVNQVPNLIRGGTPRGAAE